jgi:hypothetical protein
MGNIKYAAPPFRFVARMTTTDFNHAGWTEAGWISSSIGPDLASARTAAGLWAAKRLALSLPDVFISSLRVFNTQQVYRGAGLLVFLGTSNHGTYAPTGGSPAETFPPDAKLLTRQQNNGPPAQGVSEFIGGIPDNCISNTGFYNPDTAFQTNMAAYIAFIKANCVFVRHTVAAGHAVQPFPIIDVQVFGVLRSRKTGRPFPVDHAMDLRT